MATAPRYALSLGCLLCCLLQLHPGGTRPLEGSPRLQEDEEEYRIPADFLLGAGSSSYQIEGAWNQGGKGLSSLDHAYSNRSDSGGNVACDSYHKYTEDVALLKLMGATHYRFSIAWSRLLPDGEASNVNEEGVDYYHKLLDELEKNNIEPVVTLHHVDLPWALESRFGGWQDPRIVKYFEDYAITAFTKFGHRVRYWTTVNEPHLFCVYGAGQGRMGATRVQSGYSEYLCGHHMLLAHAAAYRVYKQRFAAQGGKVGLSLNGFYTRPCSSAYEDVRAAERHSQFEMGWFLEPLFRGDYPPVMRERVKDRLPAFTEQQQRQLNGSIDFIGLNSYFGWTACEGVPENASDISYERDLSVIIPGAGDQTLPPSAFTWSPWSLRESLLWMRDHYDRDNAVPFLITENGFTSDGSEGLRDGKRVAYISAYLRELLYAMRHDHVNVIGYLVWSLMDDFEWGSGYTVKTGLVHVDFSSPNRTRTPKDSLYFMKKVIAERVVPLVPVPSSASSGAALSWLLACCLPLLKYTY